MRKEYKKWLYKQYAAKARQRSSDLADAILQKKFPGKNRTKQKNRYRETPEFAQALAEYQSRDKKYRFYHDRRNPLGKDVEYYEEHRDWIERMADEGLRDFSEEAILEFRKKQSILNHIPDDIVDLYPAARIMKRRFILHIGPTNSGKTYHAMQALVKAGSGIYLGPLRLLAFEQYERLTDQGLPCDLATGEEEIRTEGALFQASTIDVLDMDKPFKCAVIDEAQMLTDEFRGGRWSAAIMGILADVIHICAAPEAEKILLQIIAACGDEAEVIRHERLSTLECDAAPCYFPDGVQQGDALIVFSRRSVHSIAARLQQSGLKCSVIYGALPYDVRHEEARKFTQKETDVLVATDAIGMGLNLPIRRVVLMETNKFDGRERRELHASEIKQVVGRAGRAGVFDRGFYTISDNDGMELERLCELAERPVPSIRKARFAFPESLLGLEGKVSELIMQWDKIPVKDPFEKASAEREIKLAQMLEELSSDKQAIYELITIPFDEGKPELLDRWLEFSDNVLHGVAQGFHVGYGCDPIVDPEDLRWAEQEYESLDLEYQLCKKYGDPETTEAIMMQKSVISAEINRFLATQALKEKTCSKCGRSLTWDFPYGMCWSCFRASREGHRRRR